MVHPYFTAASRPRVLAHRGFVPADRGEGRCAENTRAAFAKAVELGAEYIESDCHLTSDGEVVLVHDADLARVAGDPREIAEVSHRELRDLMRPLGGVLTLTEALEQFPGTRFNIDVKAAAAAEPAGRAAAPHAERVLLTSFSDASRERALHAASATRSDVLPATSAGKTRLIGVLLALATRSRKRVTRALAGLDALQIPVRRGPIRVCSRRLIETAHANGVEVHVWTINETEAMRSLVAMGVDGIVTDRLDLALATLHPDQP